MNIPGNRGAHTHTHRRRMDIQVENSSLARGRMAALFVLSREIPIANRNHNKTPARILIFDCRDKSRKSPS